MPPEIGSDIREIDTQKAVDEIYKSITELGCNIDRLDKEYFKLDQTTKHIYVKYGDKLIKLTYENNSNKILSLAIICRIRRNTSVAFVRDVLGVKDYNKLGVRHKTPPPVEDRAIESTRPHPTRTNRKY